MQNPRFQLGARDTFRLLGPYASRKFLDQVRGIWFIIAYLIAFQLLVLQLPIVYAAMIATGVFLGLLGLMLFMEGLRLGLMPLGELIGSVLPARSAMGVILGFAFLLGVGATFAEPAIAVLRAAGAGVVPGDAPLLFSLLNDFADQLVLAVGVGVGFAVTLGVLRFFYAWPLKYLASPIVVLLLMLTVFFSVEPHLRDVLGLAWDCGAVTTGPVTVPLVLALGIGVCRVVSSGSGNRSHSGFGIVTLASLFPILCVLLLSGYHFAAQDYYGADNYRGEIIALTESSEETSDWSAEIDRGEFEAYVATGELPQPYEVRFRGGDATLIDGEIVISEPRVVISKAASSVTELPNDAAWDDERRFWDELRSAGMDAVRAIVPLCLFLYLMLRFVLKESLDPDSDIGVGVGFALLGMALFGLGIALGLTPLGGQLGGNVPLAFAETIPWGLERPVLPLFDVHTGKMVAVVFAFFLGYGATLAEPALNALGDTVERTTAGAFRKKLLMQSVAIGVGLGIAMGILKIAYGLDLVWMLVPPYVLVLLLTALSPHNFVNFSWDSAGVTTGPITVPLVLAIGLGVGTNVPGVSDGFGILALASVGPILTVLTVGLYTQRRERAVRRTETLSAVAAYQREAAHG